MINHKNILEVVTLFSLSLLLSSCQSVPKNVDPLDRKYEDYEEFKLKDLNSFYNVNAGHYFISLYSDTCPHCEKISGNIFSYMDAFINNERDVPLFHFNMYSKNSAQGKINRDAFKENINDLDSTKLQALNNSNKPNKLKDTYFIGVPSLYEINENKLLKMYLGENEIKTLLGNF